jgi:hypothetical protein
MATEQRERFRIARARARHLVDVLRKRSDPDYVSGQMIDDIAALAISADPETLEPLIGRLETFEQQGTPYSRDLADWWKAEGQAAFLDAIPLDVTIDPISRTLAVGQSQVFTVDSNKPLSKEDLSWHTVPHDAVHAQELSAEASRKRILITAEGEGTVTLRIVDSNNVPRAEAILYIVLVEQPSKRYPVISLAATVGMGIYTLFLDSDRRDKLDAWNECREESGLSCDDLGDDYQSALDRTRIVGAATAATAILSSYLWLRYITKNNEYKKTLEVSRVPRVDVDVGARRAGIVFDF